ncbi:MAG: hypothetical protein KAJ73_00155 [Zetaproteobacteria bacterium]|nr:hypothetical protein [Zetaproteobacteria bacterium]
MKLDSIHFDPVALIQFNIDDVTLLKGCASSHYDGTCKAAGEPGGIIYGIGNIVDCDNGTPYALKFRQIDLLCKVLEFPPPHMEGAQRLFSKLWRVLNTMQEVRPNAQDFTKTDLYG